MIVRKKDLFVFEQ